MFLLLVSHESSCCHWGKCCDHKEKMSYELSTQMDCRVTSPFMTNDTYNTEKVFRLDCEHIYHFSVQAINKLEKKPKNLHFFFYS